MVLMGKHFFLHKMQALYCQNISKSGTKAISCVCKYYSSKSTLNSQIITQIYNHTNLLHTPGGNLWYFSLPLHETGESYCIFHALTTDHFLVGPGGNCCNASY